MSTAKPVLVAAVLLITFARCDALVGDGDVTRATGPPIAIVEPDYVVLRPVTASATPGAESAVLYGQSLSFHPADRIIDLRHLDARTAAVEAPQRPGGSHIVWIGTTPEGGALLREWTSQHLNEQLGVFVGGRLISAPVVTTAIDGTIILDGNFTRSEAEATVARLRRGGGAAN